MDCERYIMESVLLAKAAAYIAAGIAMGIGTIGPALGQGMIGSRACETMGKYPESASKVQGAMMLAMVLVETIAIYALLVALLLIFF